jgi:hypothetical protein
LNNLWFAAESPLTPTTSTPASVNSFMLSRHRRLSMGLRCRVRRDPSHQTRPRMKFATARMKHTTLSFLI